MSLIYSEVYVLFPKSVRAELSGKKSNEVSLEMITRSVNSIYREKIINNICEALLEYCEKQGAILLYKYHHREIDQFKNLQDSVFAKEIGSIIPAEKVLVDLYDKKIVVIGNLTSLLNVANKLGYNVISLVRIDKSDNEFAIRALINMGISVPFSKKGVVNKISLDV
ncbi:MAG: hypothetical protein R3Y45_06655 [Bacillota bacterium]